MESWGKVSWGEDILSWVLKVKWKVDKPRKGDKGIN